MFSMLLQVMAWLDYSCWTTSGRRGGVRPETLLRGRMARFIYVNGRYLPWADAAVHAEDRGFQFGDAIYEVCEVRDGRLIDETRHMQRLERSLAELKIAQPMSPAALSRVLRETVRRNRVRDGLLYLQVSRGARPREFGFSEAVGMTPTVVCLARSTARGKAEALSEAGIGVRSMPDNRWGRCDIKTVMLLPASLAKEAAKEIGAKEAWFVDERGFVTEGASSNAWIVDQSGQLITRAVNHEILRGVTRTTLIDLLNREGIKLVERCDARGLDRRKSCRQRRPGYSHQPAQGSVSFRSRDCARIRGVQQWGLTPPAGCGKY
jgi:D-alanine transaminase